MPHLSCAALVSAVASPPLLPMSVQAMLHCALPSADRRCAEQAGLTVDQVAPRLSFFFAVGMNFFQEVCDP